MTVLILIPLNENVINEWKHSNPGLEIITSSEAECEEYLSEAEVIFGNISVEKLKFAKKLQWLQLISAGIDEYKNLGESSIIVTTAKGMHGLPIAEYLIGAMMYFTKNFHTFSAKKSEKEWFRKPDSLSLLRGQKVGFIGYGGIAKSLVKLLSPFDVHIQAVTLNPPLNSVNDIAVMGMDSLEALLSSSQHIILSLPLTAQSKGLLDNRLLGKIQPNAFIYNVSRGGIIKEDALIQTLQNHSIAGAALDVFEEEPLPPSSPLWDMEQVLITPHVSGHYNGLKEDIFQLFKDNFNLFQSGLPLKNRANFKKGY